MLSSIGVPSAWKSPHCPRDCRQKIILNGWYGLLLHLFWGGRWSNIWYYFMFLCFWRGSRSGSLYGTSAISYCCSWRSVRWSFPHCLCSYPQFSRTPAITRNTFSYRFLTPVISSSGPAITSSCWSHTSACYVRSCRSPLFPSWSTWLNLQYGNICLRCFLSWLQVWHSPP